MVCLPPGAWPGLAPRSSRQEVTVTRAEICQSGLPAMET